MFKELLIVAALVSPNVVEPMRAVINENIYTIVNASNHRFTLLQGYSDEEVDFAAKSIQKFPYKVQTSDNFDLFIYKSDYPTVPTDFYYLYQASDFEDPISITFTDLNDECWYSSIEYYEPATGLQIGRYESLAGVHGWVDETKFGINGNLNSSLPFNVLTDMIPSGVSFKYVLNNGTISSTVDHMFVLKVKPSVGSINQVVLYANAAQNSIIAYNGYDPNVNPFLLYYGSFTNEVIFQSGYKTVKFGELDGSLPYYFTDLPQYFIADNDEVRESVWDSLTKSFELVGMVFAAIGTPFAWLILPGVSIGVLFLVPLLVGMFVWLIRFLKKG